MTAMLIAGEPLIIEPGTHEDLRALSGYHYLGGPPATIAGIRRARWCGLLAGVLVTSYPTLNARWRRPAWGNAYDTGDKHADAMRLNREVRCISRVIVDPRCRAVGIAVALVQSALRTAPTRRTEAVAAMGRMCPFFASAGMTPWAMPPTPASCRLLDAIGTTGRRVLDLLDPATTARATPDPFLTRELRTWARRQRHGALRNATDRELPAIAASVLLSQPVAYTHDAGITVNKSSVAHTMNTTRHTSRTPVIASTHHNTDARPLTFFLNQRECAAVRRALRTLDPDPAAALCRLLGIQRDEPTITPRR